MLHLNEMDVSKNWLLPIDDLLHSDVMERHLDRTIGIRDASGVPGYLSSALKAAGVNSLLQLLSVPEEKLKEFFPSNKPFEKIVAALEVSASRLLKEGRVPESVYAGKYAAHNDLIPLGRVEDNFSELASFIESKIYNRHVKVLPLVDIGQQKLADVFKKDRQTLTIEEMQARWKGPQHSRKLPAPKKEKPVFKKIASSSENKKPNVFVKNSALLPVRDFLDSNVKDDTAREKIGQFCSLRNVFVVGQICAFKAEEITGRFSGQVRKIFVAAVNQSTKGLPGVHLASFSAEKDRSALGLKFSEKVGFSVFPKDEARAVRSMESLLREKHIPDSGVSL